MKLGTSCLLLAASALFACSQKPGSGAPADSAPIASVPPPPTTPAPRPVSSVPPPELSAPPPGVNPASSQNPFGLDLVPGVPDVTMVDFTKNANFDPSDVTFFGARLGMTTAEAERAVNASPVFHLYFSDIVDEEDDDAPQKVDKAATIKDPNGHGVLLARLAWAKGNPNLASIELLPGAAYYLKGGAARLVGPSVIDDGDLAGFLGRPGPKKSDGDAEIGTDHYSFPSRRMAIDDARVRKIRTISVFFYR